MAERFQPRYRGPRHDKQQGATADPRAVASRQHEVERRQPANTWDGTWITGQDAIEKACLQILRGVPGRYPIFGIQAKVVIHEGERESFAALHYFDAKYGDEGQNLCGNLREGFWIGVRDLLKDPSKGYKSDDHELFTLALISQPEMQVAIGLFREEEAARRAEEKRRDEEAKRERATNRANALEKLRAKMDAGNAEVNPRAPATENQGDAPVHADRKVARPTLNSIRDILPPTTSGTVEYDGVSFLVNNGPQNHIVVRVKNAPEGHELKDVMNVYARQDALIFSADRPGTEPETDNAKKSKFLRDWLRAALQKEGVSLTPAAAYTANSDHGGNGVNHSEGKAGGDAGSEFSLNS